METICSRFKREGFAKRIVCHWCENPANNRTLFALGLNIHLSEFSFIFHSCIHMIITLYRPSVTSILQLLVAFVVDHLQRNAETFQSLASTTYLLPLQLHANIIYLFIWSVVRFLFRVLGSCHVKITSSKFRH